MEFVPARFVALFIFTVLSRPVGLSLAAGNLGKIFVSLQQKLDYRCTLLFAELCKAGETEFCGESLQPVLRKGKGRSYQNSAEYRCYDINGVSGDLVDHSELGVYCFDDCGTEVRCAGSVNQHATFHATRNIQITQWIEEEKTTYCSPLQQLLNAMCNSKADHSVGRFESANHEDTMACVSVESLSYQEEGYCISKCGLPITCVGKADEKTMSRHTSHLSSTERDQLMRQFVPPCQPYERCLHNRGEEAQCLQEEEVDLDENDDLQHWLDTKCSSAIREWCVGTNDEPLCAPGQTYVARKGYGTEDQQQQAYRCYSTAKLESPSLVNRTERGVQCLDNCGKDIPCGGTVNLGSTLHITHEDFSKWLHEAVQLFCSPAQKKVQDVCDAASPGSVARYSTSTGNPSEERQWRCLEKASIAYSGKGICFDNCYGLRSCHGGRQTTSFGWSSFQHSLTEKQIKDAIGALPRPCQVAELCLATTRNPPTCKEFHLAPFDGAEDEEIATGSNTMSSMLQDEEAIEISFTSPQVKIKVGTCFSALIDLVRGKIAFGAGENMVPTFVPRSRSPYKLSIQRRGDELVLTVWYDQSAQGGGSLFFVRPGSTCVRTEPVVLEGLERGATLTRRTLRSISSVTK